MCTGLSSGLCLAEDKPGEVVLSRLVAFARGDLLRGILVAEVHLRDDLVKWVHNLERERERGRGGTGLSPFKGSFLPLDNDRYPTWITNADLREPLKGKEKFFTEEQEQRSFPAMALSKLRPSGHPCGVLEREK